MLDYLKVVGDVKLLWIDGLMEDPCLVVLPKTVEESLGRLFPAIVDGSCLGDLLDFKSIDWSRCRFWGLLRHKVLGELWIFLAEFDPFSITERLILSILENSELIPSRDLSLIDPFWRLLNNLRHWGNGLFLVLDSILWSTTVFLEELHRVMLIALLCESKRRHSILIDVVQFGTILEKILNYIEPVALDRIVKRRLSVVINKVWIASVCNKLFDGV